MFSKAPRPTAEILSQGDEVVTGQVADTNAAWLAERLTGLGFLVTRHTSVGDRLTDLAGVMTEIAGRADVCIGTGGLGPTEDDLTAEAVATAFSRPLALDPIALQQIIDRYAAFDRRMPAINRKQALLPRGSVRLENLWGTAPGFAIEQDGTWFSFVPGVPREMRQMWTHHLLAELQRRFQVQPGRLVTLRTTGVGESTLQERLADFEPGPIVVSYRTKLPENHVKLRVPPSVPDAVVHAVVQDAAARIGSALFTVEGVPPLPGVPTGSGPLPQVVGHLLAGRGETVAVAESCTGGRVAALCTAHAGSSAWFLEGVVTYSDAAKIRMLGVEPAALQAHGAVSEAVARQMAEGARQRAGATYGLATTGIAGPGGGSDAKPVGTVHIALATPDHTHWRMLRLPGSRDRVQQLSAAGVLDLLRRHLQNHLHPGS
ncbi:MAG: nicotinamide-nucleotide amidase [Myxococcota bacterium]|jgi:nicotinamide-nucleotide amidase